MKNNTLFIVFFFINNFLCCGQSKQEGSKSMISFDTLNIPLNVSKLIKSYPEKIIGFSNNKIYFSDSSFLVYNDTIISKSKFELINNPDIEDQFSYEYERVTNQTIKPILNDAGRIRNEAFFKKIYGNTKYEVEKNLVEINWCPKLIGQRIRVTKINGIDKLLEKISSELDNHPEFSNYFKNIGGTFNWRKINGTNRMSMHSFGMTIDLNTTFSDYWQWSCKCTDENVSLNYKNRIPKTIVQIFEKYGFIWGGAWYHYDTMHFEYRPELLIK